LASAIYGDRTKTLIMRPVEFGENLAAGTKLTLFSEDKPDRFFTVLEFTLDADLGTLLGVDSPIPSLSRAR
jgi:hypothetical protein